MILDFYFSYICGIYCERQTRLETDVTQGDIEVNVTSDPLVLLFKTLDRPNIQINWLILYTSVLIYLTNQDVLVLKLKSILMFYVINISSTNYKTETKVNVTIFIHNFGTFPTKSDLNQNCDIQTRYKNAMTGFKSF